MLQHRLLLPRLPLLPSYTLPSPTGAPQVVLNKVALSSFAFQSANALLFFQCALCAALVSAVAAARRAAVLPGRASLVQRLRIACDCVTHCNTLLLHASLPAGACLLFRRAGQSRAVELAGGARLGSRQREAPRSPGGKHATCRRGVGAQGCAAAAAPLRTVATGRLPLGTPHPPPPPSARHPPPPPPPPPRRSYSLV